METSKRRLVRQISRCERRRISEAGEACCARAWRSMAGYGALRYGRRVLAGCDELCRGMVRRGRRGMERLVLFGSGAFWRGRRGMSWQGAACSGESRLVAER